MKGALLTWFYNTPACQSALSTLIKPAGFRPIRSSEERYTVFLDRLRFARGSFGFYHVLITIETTQYFLHFWTEKKMDEEYWRLFFSRIEEILEEIFLSKFIQFFWPRRDTLLFVSPFVIPEMDKIKMKRLLKDQRWKKSKIQDESEGERKKKSLQRLTRSWQFGRYTRHHFLTIVISRRIVKWSDEKIKFRARFYYIKDLIDAISFSYSKEFLIEQVTQPEISRRGYFDF